MAKYKLILTVKDKFGHEKDVEAGVVESDYAFTNSELNKVVDQVSEHLDDTFATDAELAQAVEDIDKIKYDNFDFKTD